MPISEEDVLKPVDASVTDTDEWEIFVLSDARVVYESNGKPANLLAAYADTPLTVTGRLEVGRRGQLKYFLKKPFKPTEIQIRNVTRYSYGEMNDGAFALWAQGKAGWFEIRPAEEYQDIFAEMVQAVALLYFVTDIYNEPRKRGGGPGAQLVFQEYAEDERFSCDDPAAASEIFEKHHVFLMMCFLNRAQGISWSNTPIYQYLRRHYPEDFTACKARIEGRSADSQPVKEAARSKSSATPTSDVPSVRTRSVRGKEPVQAPEQTDRAPKKDDNWWEAATLFEFMQKAVNQRALRPGRRQITLERVAQLVVKRYEIEEQEVAQHVLLVHAQNLTYMMDHPRRKAIEFFASEPIYQELAAAYSLSAAEQGRAEGVVLRPRKDHATLRDEEAESSDTSDEEDELKTPVRRHPDRRKKGRLSVLRPKSSKFSGKSKSTQGGKGKAGKGKAPVPNSDASDTDSDTEETSTADSEEMAIDTPTQALSPGREKRKLDATDVDHVEEKGRRKRTASTSIESPPTTGSDASDPETNAQNGSEIPLPLRYHPSRPQTSAKGPTVLPVLVSTPLPTYEPNGPRESWICNFDGCSQRIYGCRKELGRQLITEHLEDHAKGREKEVGILWREQDKLNLPVSNLIKKIREMNEATAQLLPLTGSDKPLPQPIKRPV